MSALVVAIVTWLCILSLKTEASYNVYNPNPFEPPPSLSFNIPISVTAYFDMNGIRGNITFSQRDISDPIQVFAEFDGLDQFGDDEMWGWHIHDCPIDFARLPEFPCSTASVGGHFDPDNRIANENYTSDCADDYEDCEIGDLSGRFGRLKPNVSQYSFQYQERGINLYEHNTFAGRSVVIHRTDGFRWACANIEYDGHNMFESLVARFPKNIKQQQNTLQGDVVLRYFSRRPTVSLSGILFRVDGGPTNTTHKWNIRRGTCDNLADSTWGEIQQDLQSISPELRPFFQPDISCSSTNHRSCFLGDLSSKCGDLENDVNGRIKFFCSDAQLGVNDELINPKFPLSLVIEENDEVLACSCFEPVVPKTAKATIRQTVGVIENGRFMRRHEVIDIQFFQRDAGSPTNFKLYTNGLEQSDDIDDDLYIQVRERLVDSNNKNCSNLGPVFEPRFGFEAAPEVSGLIQTGDRENLGELRNKIPLSPPHQSQSWWLPLFGPYSIINHSLVLHNGDGVPLNCANIEEVGSTSQRQQTFSLYS